MDTQGSFDNNSSIRDCATIFALSVLLSSVQCYNVMRNIREDDLQFLHLFTEYGKISLDNPTEKPFQSLLFIVRDWPFKDENNFGWNGGKEVVDDRLQLTDRQTKQMKDLRNQLRSSFSDIRGFLMPYPGDTVAEDKNYDGNINCISSKFKEMLLELVPELLSPENLNIKRINGQKVRAKHLLQYLKSYMTVFNGKELPEPKTVFEVSIKNCNEKKVIMLLKVN